MNFLNYLWSCALPAWTSISSSFPFFHDFLDLHTATSISSAFLTNCSSHLHISKPPPSFTTTAFVTAYEHHISINSFFIISHHLPTNLDLLVSHLKMSMFLLYWSVKALCINLSIVLLYLSTEHFSLLRSLTLSPHVIHAVATLSTPVYSTVFTR